MTVRGDERWQIHDLLVDYADAIDKRDLDRVGRCFTSDAAAVYSGIDVGPGRAEIVAFLDKHLTSLASTHFVGNVRVEFAGDHEAHTDSFVVATHVVEAEGTTLIQQRGLRYLDVVRVVDGRWRIHQRRHLPVWAGTVTGGLL